MSSLVRVADYVFSFVAQQGVKHVFLVTGGGAMFLNDALVQNKDLTFVPNHHEQACTIGAEAYSRINGHLGVAMVTTGPGSTNAITGVAGAWMDSVPMLVVSGQVKRADMVADTGVRQKGPQEIEIISIVSSITKYAVTVMEPQSIRYHLEKALHLATTGRRGPVWIAIPIDIQAAMIDPETLEGYTPPVDVQKNDLKNATANVLKLINESKRPLILAGQGVHSAGADQEFVQLYEALDIPVATTWNAVGLIPTSHKLSVGRPGVVAQRPPNFAVQNSDLLISIGARLDNVVTAYNPAKFGREAKKVIVDVDPHELAKFKMPIEEAICADARDFISALLTMKKEFKQVDRSAWIDRISQWKTRYPVGDAKDLSAGGVITHKDLVRVLSEEIPENTLIVTGSSGLAIEFFYKDFQNKPGQRFVVTSGMGAMGYGLPAMIGASFAYGKPLVGVESDGSFMVNIQELATLKEFNVPIRMFIINNNGYASIRLTQRNYFQGRSIGTGPNSRLFLPDVVGIAKVVGLPSMRISDAKDLREQVRFVLSQPGPYLCDVQVITDEALEPKCAAIPQADGSMLSMPLEDMTPLLPRDELRENMLIPLDPASEKVMNEPVKTK
jgi:acetolactate synthase-1/2/3 large subunit